MPTVRLSGSVTPVGFLWQNSGPRTLTWNDHGIHVSMLLTIADSIVTADCTVDTDAEKYLGRLYAIAFHTIRSVVDVVAFTTGFGLTLIIDTCTLPGKTTRTSQKWRR